MKNTFNKKAAAFSITFLLILLLFIPTINSIDLKEIKHPENKALDVILSWTISDNTRPEAPIVNGPHSGKVGILYTWTFMSTDPDNDNVTYYIDWGDVCGGAEYHGPYPSGVEVEISHTYTTKNSYTINSMAIDENGAESNMTYFDMSIPRARVFNNYLIQILFERFSKIFGIFEFLLN